LLTASPAIFYKNLPGFSFQPFDVLSACPPLFSCELTRWICLISEQVRLGRPKKYPFLEKIPEIFYVWLASLAIFQFKAIASRRTALPGFSPAN